MIKSGNIGLFILFSISVDAQSSNPKFDQAFADSLGANENGMNRKKTI